KFFFFLAILAMPAVWAILPSIISYFHTIVGQFSSSSDILCIGFASAHLGGVYDPTHGKCRLPTKNGLTRKAARDGSQRIGNREMVTTRAHQSFWKKEIVTDGNYVHESATDYITGVVEEIFGKLKPRPDILDLMSSGYTHLPEGAITGPVVAIGLNSKEIQHVGNRRLLGSLLQDLNQKPELPEFFHYNYDLTMVIHGMAYLHRPGHVLRNAVRTVNWGGRMLIAFSNEYYPEVATKLWKSMTQDERVASILKEIVDTGEFDVVEHRRFLYSSMFGLETLDPQGNTLDVVIATKASLEDIGQRIPFTDAESRMKVLFGIYEGGINEVLGWEGFQVIDPLDLLAGASEEE
ncbi:MAG: hypothetical protein KAI61_08485, partial [Alphaproteobacteria bacterium]|nr:hypothetical protein [Alphaproteobacteria bacterium]